MIKPESMLMAIIKERQKKWGGEHAMRKVGLENLTVTGMVEGKRSKGRQSISS